MALSVSFAERSEMFEVENYFFSTKYFDYQKKHFAKALCFQVCKSGRTVGVMHCFSNDGILWTSPGKATFGGLLMLERVQFSELFEIYRLILNLVISRGGKVIEITLPPEIHDSSINCKHAWVLRSFGSVVTNSDLNHYILVNSKSLDDQLDYSKRKRLNKCIRAGFVFESVEARNLPDIYDLLEKNRASKQHRLSLSMDQLKELILLFPDQIHLFRLVRPSDETTLSAAVCIRLSPSVLYVFYWGDDPKYSNYSSVVALACGIYSYCVQEGIDILDLGVSTLNLEGNFGLVRFKDNLGAKVCRKDKIRLRF